MLTFKEPYIIMYIQDEERKHYENDYDLPRSSGGLNNGDCRI